MRLAVILLSSVLLAGMLGCLIRMTAAGKITAGRFFLTSAIPLAAIYLLLFPMWSVPDAYLHYNAAYRYSNMLLGQTGEGQDGIPLERMCRAEDARAATTGIYENPAATDYERILESFTWTCRDMSLVPLPNPRGGNPEEMDCYSPMNYAPQILGLVTGRLLGLGAFPTAYLARIMIAAVYILSVYYSIRITPVGKHAFALIALFPMSLMLGTSFSYDAMAILSALAMAASILRLRFGEASRRNAAEAIFWTVLAGSIKGGSNLLLLPLAMLVPLNRKRGTWLVTGLIILGGVLSVIMFDVVLVSGKLFQLEARSQSRLSFSFALEQPARFLSMVFRTWQTDGAADFMDIAGRHMAWIECTFPYAVILPMLLLPAIPPAFEPDGRILGKTDLFVMAGIIATGLLLIPALMLRDTRAVSDRIEGIQGRYYFFLLLLAYVMAGRIPLPGSGKGKPAEKRVCWGYPLSGILSASAVVCMLFLYLNR